eukprot:TRINITY_DN12187_c0_g1_i1.p1 TRINITY_DN12187_c0_g1~~TRINITY_DN12187_c0_g1_i1.p1  ORF type:complete len:292 (+),score=38.53 TRINITY_DN12187_c0_g1_i1:111-986(+)
MGWKLGIRSKIFIVAGTLLIVGTIASGIAIANLGCSWAAPYPGCCKFSSDTMQFCTSCIAAPCDYSSTCTNNPQWGSACCTAGQCRNVSVHQQFSVCKSSLSPYSYYSQVVTEHQDCSTQSFLIVLPITLGAFGCMGLMCIFFSVLVDYRQFQMAYMNASQPGSGLVAVEGPTAPNPGFLPVHQQSLFSAPQQYTGGTFANADYVQTAPLLGSQQCDPYWQQRMHQQQQQLLQQYQQQPGPPMMMYQQGPAGMPMSGGSQGVPIGTGAGADAVVKPLDPHADPHFAPPGDQ